MTKQRHIDYKAKKDGNGWLVTITKQTHRGKKFSDQELSDEFQVDSEKWRLCSKHSPEVYKSYGERIFFLRGNEDKFDKAKLGMLDKRFDKFERLVAAYNETYEGDETRRWKRTTFAKTDSRRLDDEAVR